MRIFFAMGDNMKKIALGLALATSLGTAAVAGNPLPPRIEPPVIVDDATSSSSSTAIVALLALAILAAAVAAN